MIRKYTKFDIEIIVKMLYDYGQADNIKITDETAGRRLINYILAGGGIGLVNERNGIINGMLLAIITPQIWDHTKYIMNELCLWVDPEARGSTAGFRLIDAYVNHGNDMIDNNQITSFTISQHAKQKLNYSRWGFKELETTWINQ